MNSPEDKSTQSFSNAQHPRYEWLDEMRGIVAILYMVSVLTSPLKGSPIWGIKPLGPTYLNHGFNYLKSFPSLLTPIDLGQSMFVFILGFAGYIAFAGRLRLGSRVAAQYAVRRVALLYGLSFFEAGGLNWIKGKGFHFDAPEFFYGGVIAKLAVAALCVYIFTFLVRSADRRVLLGLFLMAVHAVLYSFHFFDRYYMLDDELHLPQFPFGALNLAAIAVIGSAFSQHLSMDPNTIHRGLKLRVLPISVAFLVGAYCLEWIQPSEQHDVTTSLAMLATGLSGFSMCAAYSMEVADLQIPLLGALGRNLILVFIVFSEGVDAYVKSWPVDKLAAMPFVTLIFIAILPIFLMTRALVFLDRRRIWLRL